MALKLNGTASWDAQQNVLFASDDAWRWLHMHLHGHDGDHLGSYPWDMCQPDPAVT